MLTKTALGGADVWREARWGTHGARGHRQQAALPGTLSSRLQLLPQAFLSGRVGSGREPDTHTVLRVNISWGYLC